MIFKTLISVEGLAQYYRNPDWRVVDCRFWLENTSKGRLDYDKAHIPGAVYADLDNDLSGEVIPGETGRHPLPSIEEFVSRVNSWGIDSNTQVIVYDDRGGMIAARLWWMLRWLGHEAVALLNGGYTNWVEGNLLVANEVQVPLPKIFKPNLNNNLITTENDILLNFGDPRHALVDSRSPERYRGEIEPIDPVAGRIPGAYNYFWKNNLDSNNCFKIKAILRGRFETLIGNVPVKNVTFYCGSGVTSAHNILALNHAGLGMAKLYVGSWSQWITDKERPIVVGD
jgi:thiosulfate/3-mercaptopyruvate sulfurtransferase